MFKFLKILVFLFTLFIFCYFRLKPIYFQTVGYTYDQGRDFLKASEIIRDRNITFIGPTTGIQGLFHGAWYYYLLLIPFLVFNAVPIGFYYFNFLIHLVSFLLFAYFLHKYFGFIISIIISSLIAASPYFIFTSTFVGNNIMVLPTFLLLLLINYFIYHNKPLINLSLIFFLNGLLIGFVSEFEVAFGMFLIPSYLFIIFAVKNIRVSFFRNRNALFFLFGFIIPFIPRILFEIKNNFSQTKILFSQFFSAKSQVVKTFADVFGDRLNLFFGYYRGLFASDFLFLVFTLSIFLYVFILLEKKIKSYDHSINVFLFLLFSLFSFSVFYKNNSFWSNYYEGIQYLYLLLLAIILSIELKNVNYLAKGLRITLVIILLIVNANILITDLQNKVKPSGHLRSHLDIVNYIQTQEKNKINYCVKIYTPPVIPFTYSYIFLYNSITSKIPIPQEDWVDDKCWYIIETDDYKDRRDQWIKNNIPEETIKVQSKSFNTTALELWKK